MDNVDLQVLRQVVAWRAAAHAVVLGTITRTWGSAPRPVGSLVAVRDDGRIAGSVSGGCVEDDLVDRVRGHALSADTPQIVRYGVGGDEAARFGLPCGGTLELVLEPLAEHSQVAPLLHRLAAGERVRRTLDLASGTVTLSAAEDHDMVMLDDRQLVSVHGPDWRLMIIGAGQISQYLAQMAQALGYQVLVCDPRDEHGSDLPGAQRLTEMPDDAVLAMQPDAHCAIIALTHDPKLDDLALMEALRSRAFYVGAIGSRANQLKRKQRLHDHFGLTDTELGRLHGPVGLKYGARTPPEIAVAILAEMTATRYGHRIPEPVRLGAPAQAVQAGCPA